MMKPNDPVAESPISAEAPASLGAMRRPYANVQGAEGPTPMGAAATAASNAEKNLAKLPPDMQEMVLLVLGSDPMIASALLTVLGPGFEPLIRKAMTAGSAEQGGEMASGGAALPEVPHGGIAGVTNAPMA